MTESSKEIRYRVWWAICSTERILAVMTGRPTSVLERDCTAPMPLPIDEDLISDKEALAYTTSRSRRHSPALDIISSPASITPSTRAKPSPANPISPVSHHSGSEKIRIRPSHALYFSCHTKLSILTNEVLDGLYRAGVVSESWEGIQNIICTLESKLEQWHSELPPVFDFDKKQRDQQFVRQRMSLGFLYYSTLMIINRPCLCNLHQRIPNESRKSIAFNRSAAISCVHAAKNMMELLPEEPNPIGLYKVAPWWCIVHHLVQAATVLMLELSLCSEHLPLEAEEILETTEKAIHWLKSMSQENIAAHRAWRLCDEMLQTVAPKIGRAADGLPTPFSDSAERMETSFTTPVLPQDRPGPHHYLTHSWDARYYPDMQPGNPLFQLPTYAVHDDFLASSQIPTSFHSPQTNTVFPSLYDMDAMMSEDAQEQRFPANYDHQWGQHSGI